MLAFAGPYNINKISVSFFDAQSDVYTNEYYEPDRADKMMKDAVKKLEEK